MRVGTYDNISDFWEEENLSLSVILSQALFISAYVHWEKMPYEKMA